MYYGNQGEIFTLLTPNLLIHPIGTSPLTNHGLCLRFGPYEMNARVREERRITRGVT